MLKELFEKVLGIEKPRFIEDLKSDAKQRQLDIYINFEFGRNSNMFQISGTFGVYNIVNKT